MRESASLRHLFARESGALSCPTRLREQARLVRENTFSKGHDAEQIAVWIGLHDSFAQGFYPREGMVIDECDESRLVGCGGGFLDSFPLERRRGLLGLTTAHFAQVQKLDAHMVLVLVVLIGKLEAGIAQERAHLKRRFAEADGRALCSVQRLPRRSRGRRRPDEKPRVFDGNAFDGVFAIFASCLRERGARRNRLGNSIVSESGKRFPKRRIKADRRRLVIGLSSEFPKKPYASENVFHGRSLAMTISFR